MKKRNRLLSLPHDGFWSALFIWDLIVGDEKSTPLKRLSPSPTITTETVHADGADIMVDIYRSRVRSPAPAILLCHGFAHLGHHDPRIIRFCQRLARAGFVVMAPDFPLLKNYRLGFEDVDVLVSCFTELQRFPEVDPDRVGVFGFSFGSSLVLIGLSRPEMRDKASFGCTFGGYCNLRRTLRYVLTGAYEGEGHAGKVEPIRRQDRWKFLRGNAHLLPPSSSRDAYVAFLSAKIEDPYLNIKPTMGQFSPEEQQALLLIENEDPEQFDALFAPIAPYYDPWLNNLSLYHYTPSVRTQMLIGHSLVDPVSPFTESLDLRNHLSAENQPYVAIISLFAHVDLHLNWRSLKGLVSVMLPDLSRLWGLVYRVFRA